MRRIGFVLLTVLLMNCNNSENSGNAVRKTQSDSVMDEVMKGHNMGMAKMERVAETKKKIQHLIDSVSGLPYALQQKATRYRMQLDSVFNRLTFAGYAMDKWMDEFDMDTLKENEEERVKYLQSEKSKIARVNEVMGKSIQIADSLLSRK